MKPTPKLSRLIREYPAEWLECRATSRHDLKGLRVQTDTGARVYRITEVCSRCGTVRRQTLTFGGLLVHAETSYVRPDGYDLPEELVHDVAMRPLWRLERVRRVLAES